MKKYDMLDWINYICHKCKSMVMNEYVSLHFNVCKVYGGICIDCHPCHCKGKDFKEKTNKIE